MDAFVATTELGFGTWFTDVVFVPLVEVADYGLLESLDPDGVPSKQDRSKVLRMVGDLNFIMIPGEGGGGAIWDLAWYIGRFGKEETDNAVGNTASGGLVNYDPLQTPGPFLFKQQAIIQHRYIAGESYPVQINGTDGWALDQRTGIRNFHFDKKMGLPLKTDDELYLILAAGFGQTTENAPEVRVSYQLRFLISD